MELEQDIREAKRLDFTGALARFQNPSAGGPRNEREEQLDRFLVRLNAARIADNFKPMSYSHLAFLLTKIPTKDLHAFYQECDRARSFSKYFHWALKPSQITKNQHELDRPV